jgi:Holliday junction resolvasome RuvABC endonuclease subunit
MRVMGIDPGVTNFAVVVIDGHDVVYARMIQNTIHSMARACYEERALHRDSMRKLMKHTRPDVLLLEQFAVRGFGTQLTEVINIMIGGIQMLCDSEGVAENAVMASTWKKCFKQIGDLDALYSHAKLLNMEHHVVDALCIAFFMKNNFGFIKADWRRIKKGLEVCRMWLLKNSVTHVRIPKPKKKKARAK